MMIVCISRASFFGSVLGEGSSRKLELSILFLSFNNDCDRQQNQSDFQMICYDRLFLFGGELIVSRSCLGMA